MQYSNTCVKCGGVFAVRKEVLLKRIIKHGSLEKLNAEYQCQKCRAKNSTVDLEAEAAKLREALAAEKAKKATTVKAEVFAGLEDDTEDIG